MIEYFIRHRTAANLLMLALIAAGLLSINSLRRETFPNFAPRKVSVTVVWPGATPADIEESICRRIEDGVQSISGVVEMISEARDGVAVVTVEMRKGTDSGIFLSDVKSEVDAIQGLPEEAEDPRIELIGRADKVIQVVISGPMSAIDLRSYCDEVQQRFRLDSQITQVKLLGFSDHLLRVELRPEALRAYGLSVAAVGDAIARQAIDLPAGSIEAVDRELVVRIAQARKTVAELDALVVIGGAAGAEVRLAQLGQVVETFAEPEKQIVLRYRDGNGSWLSARAGVLEIEKARHEDTLRIADAVKARVRLEQDIAPPGVRFHIANNIATLVRSRLNLLLDNGLQGLLLIFAVLWMFFNLRYAFWVAMSLPVSFLAAFYFFGPLGLTLNMITMIGLLMGLGLLMDDSLVIAENIATHTQRGTPPAQAAVEGVRQIRVGILSSFLTTLVVFGPLTQLAGTIGDVLKAMPVVLILVMAVSLIEAFWILPNHLSHAKMKAPGRLRSAFERRFLGLTSAVGRLAAIAIGWRYAVVAGAASLLLIAISFLAGGTLKFQPFPDLEGDLIEARILMPAGTPLARTEAVAERLIRGLIDVANAHPQPDQKPLIELVRIQYGENRGARESGPHVATISVDLLSTEHRRLSIEQLSNRWREAVGPIPDVVSLSLSSPTIGPAGKALAVRLAGNRLGQLDAAARDLKRYLAQFDGVANLSSDLRPGREELLLEPRAGALGNQLDARQLGLQVASALRGRDVADVQLGSASKTVQVRLARNGRATLDAVERLPIFLPDGSQATLSSVATLQAQRGWSKIGRIDGRRTVTIEGDVDTRRNNAGEIRQEMLREWVPQLAERFPGVEFALDGEATESGTTQASMRVAALIGLLGVFFVLSFQFGSYFEPLVVMAAIPLAMVGVVAGHLLMGYPLTMPSMLGLASLAGVVVNDSILLVTFLKENRISRPELSTADAAAEASRLRFRAIFLTSVTTIFGLIPLMFERSVQAQVLIPLAIAIIFGLLASTALVLVVIPSLYCILDDWGLTTLSMNEDTH